MSTRPKDQHAKAIARFRRAFRRQCHQRLDSYLSETDPETGLPTIDVLIAYAGQGWGVTVGVGLQQPAPDPEEPTSLEERATAAGLTIVSA